MENTLELFQTGYFLPHSAKNKRWFFLALYHKNMLEFLRCNPRRYVFSSTAAFRSLILEAVYTLLQALHQISIYVFLPVYGSDGFCFCYVDLSCVSLYLYVFLDFGVEVCSCDVDSLTCPAKPLTFSLFNLLLLLLSPEAITSKLKSCQSWKQKSIFTFLLSKIA